MLFNCKSEIDEYREIENQIQKLKLDAINESIESDIAAKEIAELLKEQSKFDSETIKQYSREEEAKKEIKEKQKQVEESRIKDSIKNAKLEEKQLKEIKKKKELQAKKREDSLRILEREMIEADEAFAEYEYLEELKEKGLFLVEFGNNEFEASINEWANWKKSQNYDSNAYEEALLLRNSIDRNKLQNLTNSMYRTLSNGIAKEGLTMKSIQGIQIYNILRTGEKKFD